MTKLSSYQVKLRDAFASAVMFYSDNADDIADHCEQEGMHLKANNLRRVSDAATGVANRLLDGEIITSKDKKRILTAMNAGDWYAGGAELHGIDFESEEHVKRALDNINSRCSECTREATVFDGDDPLCTYHYLRRDG